MTFLETEAGFLSSRWIVRLILTDRGDYEVSYTYGTGMIDTRCSQDEGDAFIRRVREGGQV